MAAKTLQHAGFEVSDAGDGEAALALFAEHKYDLVLHHQAEQREQLWPEFQNRLGDYLPSGVAFSKRCRCWEVRMRYVLTALLAATVLTPSVALAEEPDWREVTNTSEGVVEVDAANIRVRERKLTAWVRHTTPSDMDKDGIVFRSAVSLMVFDCDAEQSGLSSTTAFAGPRGEGKVVHTEEGLPIPLARLSYERPGTAGYKVLKFVCEPHKRLSPALKQATHAQEMAELVKDPPVAGPPARITRAVNPNDYYPARSVLRGELGSPVVMACVGPDGNLLREPVITVTSGFRDLDKGAIKAAKAMQFAAGTENGTAVAESCVEIRLKFDLSKR